MKKQRDIYIEDCKNICIETDDNNGILKTIYIRRNDDKYAINYEHSSDKICKYCMSTEHDSDNCNNETEIISQSKLVSILNEIISDTDNVGVNIIVNGESVFRR